MYRPKLFVGIELDDRTRAKCASIIERLHASGFPARFELIEKLHITVAFLGWTDAERVGDITQALQEVVAASHSFEITLDKVGAFPTERRPRVVWIGSRGQPETFRALALHTRKSFENLGFVFEKEPVAHVTIARVKGGNAELPLLEITPMKMAVREITLFESLPAGRTTRYEVRQRASLKSPL